MSLKREIWRRSTKVSWKFACTVLHIWKSPGPEVVPSSLSTWNVSGDFAYSVIFVYDMWDTISCSAQSPFACFPLPFDITKRKLHNIANFQHLQDYFQAYHFQKVFNSFSMAASSVTQQLRANLGMPDHTINAHKCLYVHQGSYENALKIYFRRTVRVVSYSL